jgi:SAM-dependent methyltransferase
MRDEPKPAARRPGDPSSATEHYVFRGGDAGRERLRVLARVVAPSTGELFARLGVSEGWRCLDVGCGGGDATVELARLVHPAVVTGLDVDESKLAIARREAQAAGIDNVDYRFGDAAQPDEWRGDGFDLVYVRFLLTHLPAPEAVLAALVARARRGGLVAVEDIDVEGSFCAPPSAAFDRYVEWYTTAHRARGGDPTIGRRLPMMLRQAGLTDIGTNVAQPAGTSGDIMLIAPLTLAAATESIVANGVATAVDVERVRLDLDALSADPGHFVAMPRVVQAWGRRA